MRLNIFFHLHEYIYILGNDFYLISFLLLGI